jgi:hypothetical protein
MNYGRLVLAAVVAMIIDLIYGYAVYGMALGSFFAVAPGVFRPLDAVTQHLPALLGGTALGMLAATAIYAKGYEGKSGLAEGLRFGLLIAIFAAGYFNIANSAVMNYGLKLAAVMSVAAVGEWLIVGATIGLLYKPAVAAR